MTEFLISTALLSLLALGFVLWPLFRHADPATPGALAGLLLTLVLTGSASGLYFWLGTPGALNPAAMQRMPTDLKQAVAQLTRRMQAQPDRLDGWMLLGRSQTRLGNHAAAVQAFTQALRLAPDNPDVLTSIAEASVQMSADHRFAGEPQQWLEKAVALAPNHQRALWLAGIAATQAGDMATARKRWSHLLQLLPANSDIAKSLRQQMARFLPSTDTPAPPRRVAANQPITVHIELAAGLDGSAFKDWTLFVLAREPGGGKMPLAVRKVRAPRFPLDTELSDAMSMLSGRSLASAGRLEIVARLSRSGTAMAQAGDYQGLVADIDPQHTRTVNLIIGKKSLTP